MAERPRCVLLADVVVISAEVAPVLLHLLTPGLARARYDSWSLPPALVDVVAGLRHLEGQAVTPDVIVTPAVRWITTREAACLLGVSPRQVTNLVDRLQHRRKGKRAYLFSEADVLEEVEARSEAFGSDRNPLIA